MGFTPTYLWLTVHFTASYVSLLVFWNHPQTMSHWGIFEQFFLGSGNLCGFIYEQKNPPPNVGFFGLGVRQSAIFKNRILGGFFLSSEDTCRLYNGFCLGNTRKGHLVFFVDDLVACPEDFHLVGPGSKKTGNEMKFHWFFVMFFSGCFTGWFQIFTQMVWQMVSNTFFLREMIQFDLRIFFSWVETTSYLSVGWNDSHPNSQKWPNK